MLGQGQLVPKQDCAVLVGTTGENITGSRLQIKFVRILLSILTTRFFTRIYKFFNMNILNGRAVEIGEIDVMKKPKTETPPSEDGEPIGLKTKINLNS